MTLMFTLGGCSKECGLCPETTPLVAVLVFPVVEDRRGRLETQFVRKLEHFAQLGDGHALLEMRWGLLQVATVLPSACVRRPRGGAVAVLVCLSAVALKSAMPAGLSIHLLASGREVSGHILSL